MRKLTKAERETIISTTEADKTWRIFTENKPMMRRLRVFSEQYPDYCHLVQKSEAYESEEYDINEVCFSVRLNPPVSEKRKEAARKQLEMNIRRSSPAEKAEDSLMKTAV